MRRVVSLFIQTGIKTMGLKHQLRRISQLQLEARDNGINGYKSYAPIILNRLERKVMEKKARKKNKAKN